MFINACRSGRSGGDRSVPQIQDMANTNSCAFYAVPPNVACTKSCVFVNVQRKYIGRLSQSDVSERCECKFIRYAKSYNADDVERVRT